MEKISTNSMVYTYNRRIDKYTQGCVSLRMNHISVLVHFFVSFPNCLCVITQQNDNKRNLLPLCAHTKCSAEAKNVLPNNSSKSKQTPISSSLMKQFMSKLCTCSFHTKLVAPVHKMVEMGSQPVQRVMQSKAALCKCVRTFRETRLVINLCV